jgi:outer membrane protein assembly factor BamB
LKRLYGICVAIGVIVVLQAGHEYAQEFYTNGTAYREGVLYSGAPNGRFVAVDVRSRRLAWTFQDAGLKGFLKPAFTGDGIFLLGGKPSWDTEVVALDRSTGKPLWRYPFVEAVRTSSPVVCDGNLILTDYKRGLVVALDVKSGKVRWDTGSQPYHFFHPPAVSGSELYLVVKDKGADVGRGIAVLNCSDGKPRRVIQVEGIGVSECPILLHDGKAILTDMVYDVGSNMTLLDLRTEQKIWTIKVPSIHAGGPCPAVADTRLISGSGGPWVLDLKTGRTLVDQRLDEAGSQTDVYKDSMVFVYGRRNVYAFRIDPFRLLWKTRLSKPLASNVVVCGDAICVQTQGEKVALLNPTSGKLVAHVRLTESAPKN